VGRMACPPPSSHRVWSSSEQAYVPAEQPSAGEGPWLPRADAYPGRPRRAGRAPPQGPRAARRLTPLAGGLTGRGSQGCAGGVVLPQQTRMRSPEEFRRTLRSGRRAGGTAVSGALLLPVGPVPIDAVPKVGFVVSRAVGSAVVRNRVKRRLRELMRRRIASLPGGCLLVLRAHPAAAGARQADLVADLDLVIGRLLRRQVGALRQE
jgi:ribonuclease P protein component